MDFRELWLGILNNPLSGELKIRLAKEALRNLGYRDKPIDLEEELQRMKERMSSYE